MDIELLHKMCKEDTRKGFDEFKRIIEIQLFGFNENTKEDMQNQLIQGLCSRTIKHFIMNFNLSNHQIAYLTSVTNQ